MINKDKSGEKTDEKSTPDDKRIDLTVDKSSSFPKSEKNKDEDEKESTPS